MSCESPTGNFDAQRFDLSKRMSTISTIISPQPSRPASQASAAYSGDEDTPEESLKDVSTDVNVVSPRPISTAERLGLAIGRACSPVARIGSPVMKIASPVGRAVGSLGHHAGVVLQINPLVSCMEISEFDDGLGQPGFVAESLNSSISSLADSLSEIAFAESDSPITSPEEPPCDLPTSSSTSLATSEEGEQASPASSSPADSENESTVPVQSFPEIGTELSTDITRTEDEFTVTRTIVRPASRGRLRLSRSRSIIRSRSPSPFASAPSLPDFKSFASLGSGAPNTPFEREVTRVQDDRDRNLLGLARVDVKVQEEVDVKEEVVHHSEMPQLDDPRYIHALANPGCDHVLAHILVAGASGCGSTELS